jgi:hypothetical protein
MIQNHVSSGQKVATYSHVLGRDQQIVKTAMIGSIRIGQKCNGRSIESIKNKKA